MKMIPVKSSNIKAIGHDRATGTLHVHFNNGAKWEYKGVPARHFQAMLHPDTSVGGYLHAHIKGRHEGKAL